MVTKKILYEPVDASVAPLLRPLPTFMRLPHIADLAEKFLEAVALPNDPIFLNNDAGSLSGGISKRLAVARALSMNPIIVFL